MGKYVYQLTGKALLLLLALVLTSCADGNRSPVLPSNAIDNPSWTASFILPENRTLLGFYSILIPADRSGVDVVAERSAMMHLNTVRLLEVTPCSDCLVVEHVNPINENRVQITVSLRHPFSSEQKNLTGFDVRGIVMLPADVELPEAGVDAAWGGEAMLVGPDGWTRLFNPTEFPEGSPGPPALGYITGRYASPGIAVATLNPYLVFVPETERNHFPPGSSASRVYDLKLPDGAIELGYAVDVSWYPADGPVENVPDDFPLSANSLEAYRVLVSIGKGLTPTGTGTANVRIDVYDWQGLDTIDKVLIEAPDLFDGEVEASLSTVEDESFIFYGHIQNEKHAPIGDYPLLVTVKDTEEDPNLGPLAAYQLVTAHVTLTGVWIRELVLIPAGYFIMGSDPDVDPQSVNYPEETPQHDHWTDEYYIGRYEITNEEFMSFMTDGGFDNPDYWSPEGWQWLLDNDWNEPQGWGKSHQNDFGPQFPDYPAWNLRWYEAEAFCNWAGGRLPTEAEWEKAARGTDARIFPWGNEWDPGLCRHDFAYGPLPVGSFSPEGDSPYGLCDSVGNADEFTADWFVYHIYLQYATGDFTPPGEPDIPSGVAARGGRFSEAFTDGRFRCAYRGITLKDNALWGGNGFRIVFDP